MENVSLASFKGAESMNDLEKYEKLRLHIKQQVTDIEASLDSIGTVEKLAKQMELIFLDQMLEKMNQLDNEGKGKALSPNE